MKVDLTFDEAAALRSVARTALGLFQDQADLTDVERLLVESLTTANQKLERAGLADRIHHVMTAGKPN